MESTILFNIQRFCLHDGDGIRTTFFFKGCPLRCSWCHNPEGLSYKSQIMFYAEKCRSCVSCGAIADDECIYGAREIMGKAYTVDELIHIADKDAEFYKSSSGGVTLSGGEVLAQPRAFLHALTSGLKLKGFHIAVDTCGHVPFEAFENVREYVDIFLYDVKFIDNARHLRFTGVSNELILENLKKLSDTVARIEIRIPVIEGVNSDDAEMNGIMQYIKDKIKVEKIRLLPYHAIGNDKYTRIGMTAKGKFSAPSEGHMCELAEMFRRNNLPII